MNRGSPPPVRRLLCETLAVGLAWCLLPLLRMPGLALHPASRIWGSAVTDTASQPWTLWHVAWHLRHEVRLGLETQLVGFPEGGLFWPMSPIESVLMAPVTLALGAVVATNLLQLLHVGLAGSLCYALLRRVGLGLPPALAVTPVLALSPVLLCCVHNGNLEVAQLFWMPAAGLACWEAVGRGGWRWLVAAGLVLAAALVSNTYVGFATVPVVVALGLARDPRAWRRVLAVLGLGILLAAPLLWVALDLSLGDASLMRRDAATVFRQRIFEGQARLSGFFVPGVVPARSEECLPNGYLNAWAPGTVALLLALWALVRVRGALRWWLLGLALVGVSLALGPVLMLGSSPVLVARRMIPGPYGLIDWLPPFDSLIELWRFAMVVHLAVAMLAALALARLPRWIAGAAGVAMLTEALLLNPGFEPWVVTPLPDPELAELMEGVEPGAVAHLPMRQGHWPLYWQTVHEHPVGSTMVDAFDPELFGEVVAPSWNLADMRDLARRRGFRWLVVHGSEEMYVLQPLERILADLEGAGLVARSAGPLSLVDLADPGPWPKAGYTMHDRPVPDPNSEAARTEVNIWEDCGIDLGG